MVNNEMKFIDNVLPDVKTDNTKYAVFVLMKNYNVWHKDCECTSFETALKAAQRLEKKCECFTEIRKIVTFTTIFRRYAYY